MPKHKSNLSSCPCGSNKLLNQCCQVYINEELAAPTAEALMRSRYTAYTLLESRYLLDTWLPQPSQLQLDPDTRWLGLKIISCEAGQMGDDDGWVHFRARYKKLANSKAQRLEEHSAFKCIQNRWYYVGIKAQ